MADKRSWGPFPRRPGGGSPRYPSIWRRITGRKGFDIDDARPVVVLENDRPEYLLSGETRPWGAAVSFTSGVGLSPKIQIFNPLSSGIISVVLSMRASVEAVSASAFLTLVLADTALATLDTGISNSDTRAGVITGISSNRLLSTQIRHTDAALTGVTASIRSVRLPVGFVSAPIEMVVPGPVVLGPGSGVLIFYNANQMLLSVDACGYERTIESGEEGPL